MADIKQHDDGSLSIHSDQEGTSLLRIGGPSNPAAGGGQVNYRGVQTVKIPLLNAAANLTGGMCTWANPFTEKLLVGRTTLVVNTGQTQTFTISVGTCPLSAGFPSTTANLIDSYNYNTSDTTPVVNNIDDHGTNGKSKQVLNAGDAIIASCNRQLLTGQITLYAEFSKI